LKESQSTKADWWNELTLAEKEAIDQGLEDADKGNVMAHEDVRKRYSKWL
jgi:predicted transcriptional regulator